jgi:hypothetical protein
VITQSRFGRRGAGRRWKRSSQGEISRAAFRVRLHLTPESAKGTRMFTRPPPTRQPAPRSAPRVNRLDDAEVIRLAATTDLINRDGSFDKEATPRRIGRIVIRGEFGPLLAAALPECEISVASSETHIAAPVLDEAELFGVLERLRDLGAA